MPRPKIRPPAAIRSSVDDSKLSRTKRTGINCCAFPTTRVTTLERSGSTTHRGWPNQEKRSIHMPRFYIDTYDGTSFNADQQGVILKDRAAARYAAIDKLPDIARQVLPDGDRRVMMSQVWDKDRQPVFRAILTLTAQWLDDCPDAVDIVAQDIIVAQNRSTDKQRVAMPSNQIRVYQFRMYDICFDEYRTSRRYATAAAVAKIRGAEILDGGVDISVSDIGVDAEGMTVRDYRPL